MKVQYLLFLIAFSMSFVLCGAIDVSGNVSGVWSATDNPYNVVGNITVPNGETLTILSGVEVIFGGNFQFTVQGNVIATAAEGDSIRFRKLENSSGWNSIRLENTTSPSEFYHCIITGGTIGIHSINAPFNLTNSRIGEMSDKGISIFGIGGAANINIKYSKIHDTFGSGIHITENSAVTIFGNEITRCSMGAGYVGAIQLSNQTPGGNCSPAITANHIHHNYKQGIIVWDITATGTMNSWIEDNIIERNLTGIYLRDAECGIANNVIRDNYITGDTNSGAGIMLAGANCVPEFIQYNTISGNFTGLFITENATIGSGQGNIIVDNIDGSGSNWSIYLWGTTANVYATRNFFGTSNATEIATSIFDSNDFPGLGTVIFEPFIIGAGVITGIIQSNVANPNEMMYTVTAKNMETGATSSVGVYKTFQMICIPGLYSVYIGLYGDEVSGFGSYGGFDEPTLIRVVENEIAPSIELVVEPVPQVSRKRTYEQSFMMAGREIFPMSVYLSYIRDHLWYLFEEGDFIYFAGERKVNLDTDQWDDFYLDEPIPYLKVRNLSLYEEYTTPFAEQNIVRHIGETVQIDMVNNIDGYDMVIQRLFLTPNVGITAQTIFTPHNYGMSQNLTPISMPDFPGHNSYMPLESHKEFVYNPEPLLLQPTELRILPDGFMFWNPSWNGFYTQGYPVYLVNRIYRNGQLYDTIDIRLTYYWIPVSDMVGSWYVVSYSDYHGPSQPTNTVEVSADDSDVAIPKPTISVSSYPNPFNMSIGDKLHFDIRSTQNEEVTLELYNIKGQKVASLYTGKPAQDELSVSINRARLSEMNLSSGIYFYRLKTPEQNITKKILLIK